MRECYYCYFRPVCDGRAKCKHYTDIREDASDPYEEQDRRQFTDDWVRYIHICEAEGLLTLEIYDE